MEDARPKGLQPSGRRILCRPARRAGASLSMGSAGRGPGGKGDLRGLQDTFRGLGGEGGGAKGDELRSHAL